ncbi:MAG: endospore germination permease [Clostridiaceae bacterium]
MKMQNKVSFGRWEAVTLLINLISTKLFLYFARMTVEDAGTAGWIMTIYICLVTAIVYMALISLFKKFDGKDILDIAEYTGGKPLKIFTGLLITSVLFYSTTAVLREFSEDMKVVSLPSSPLSYIIIFFIIGVVAGSYLGIEAILRYHAIIVPIIATGYIFILLGAIPQMDLTNILPILGNGLNSIFMKGFFRISVFGELMIIFLLPPFLGSYKNVRSVGYISIAFSSVFLISGSLTYILTYPYPSGLESFLPIYQMARLINLGRFFQRIEALFVFIWAMAAFIYLTATFYFMVYTFSKSAGLKYMRPMIFPFAILVFSAAFVPKNLMEVINIETQYFGKMAWIATFIFTFIILAAANLRKKSEKEKLDR